MVIVINGYPYIDVTWEAERDRAVLTLKSDLTLAELEERFDVSAGTVIEQYNDDEELIGKWYMHNLAEIGYKKDESGSWDITAIFFVSSIALDKAEELADNIDESDAAIVELAELYTELEATIDNVKDYVESEIEEVKADIENISARVNTCDENVLGVRTELSDATAGLISQISALSERLDALADRVARLENK